MSRPTDDAPDPRLVAKWAERYARSRTLPFLVQWVFIVTMVGVLGALALGTTVAYHTHHVALLWVCVGITAAVTLALTWFSASKWGGEQIWRISQWLYGKEGYAAYSGGEAARRRRQAWWIPAIAIGLAAYHLTVFVLVGLRRVPLEYLQPLSALYMAPFLAVMIPTQRLGFWAWVLPICYAAHAVAILAGAPHFTGNWFPLDIFVPIFGYGLVAIIVGHFYSRYALRKLKGLARAGIPSQPEPPEDGDSE